MYGLLSDEMLAVNSHIFINMYSFSGFFAFPEDSSAAGIEDDVVDINTLVESLSREAEEPRRPHPIAVSSKV